MGSSRGYSWHAHAAIAGVVEGTDCMQAVIRAWSQQRDRTSIAYRGLTIGSAPAFATALESANRYGGQGFRPAPQSPRTRVLTLQFGEAEGPSS